MYLHSVSENDKGEGDDEEDREGDNEEDSSDDDYDDDADADGGEVSNENEDDDDVGDDKDPDVEQVIMSGASEHVTIHANVEQDHIRVNFNGVSSHLAYNYAPAMGPYSEFPDIPIRYYELVCRLLYVTIRTYQLV